MPLGDIADAYDLRSDEYIERFGSVEQLSPLDRTTIGHWRDATSGMLLDAGCGPGHWTDELRDHGRRRVLGIDGSNRFLKSARGRFPAATFARADLNALPVASGSVGGLLAWYSVIHTPPAAFPALLAEFSRVLRPGGSLLLGFVDGDSGVSFDHAVTTAWYWSSDAIGELLTPLGFVVARVASRQDLGVRRHGEIIASVKN